MCGSCSWGSTRHGSGNTAALRTVQALAPDGITAEPRGTGGLSWVRPGGEGCRAAPELRAAGSGGGLGRCRAAPARCLHARGA